MYVSRSRCFVRFKSKPTLTQLTSTLYAIHKSIFILKRPIFLFKCVQLCCTVCLTGQQQIIKCASTLTFGIITQVYGSNCLITYVHGSWVFKLRIMDDGDNNDPISPVPTFTFCDLLLVIYLRKSCYLFSRSAPAWNWWALRRCYYTCEAKPFYHTQQDRF